MQGILKINCCNKLHIKLGIFQGVTISMRNPITSYPDEWQPHSLYNVKINVF